MRNFDVIIIGAGIIGLSCARALLAKQPSLKLMILEKEDDVARHQSSRNSGVLHTGIYYPPGSLKAALCRQGRALLLDYLNEEALPYQMRGKLIVATSEQESQALAEIARRGRENEVPFEEIEETDIRRLEPAISGRRALWVPGAAVVSFADVCRRLRQQLAVEFDAEVRDLKREGDCTIVSTPRENYRARFIVNAAGLYSDVIARRAGIELDHRIVPFRGEYYRLSERAAAKIRSMVYPVPDPRYPFLGIHFTRKLDDSVEVGPNAVLALGRNSYSWGQVQPLELLSTLSYGGFNRLARKHLMSGIQEVKRSLSTAAYARQAARLYPGLQASDLTRGSSGVRAQCLRKDGTLLDDFLIKEAEGSLHLLNAPSPAATSSLALAEKLSSLILKACG